MTTVHANGISFGIDRFGDDDEPLVLLVGGTTMLSWPDALCERIAVGGRRVERYDLRDSGESALDDAAMAIPVRRSARSPRRCSGSDSGVPLFRAAGRIGSPHGTATCTGEHQGT